MYVYLCITCMSYTCEGQKRALKPLELELKEDINMWVLGAKPRSSARTTSTLNR